MPNVITSLNLICGVLAVLLASQGYITIAAWFIVLAAVMDFLDGMAARVLKAYSEVGEQLDSLADLISFGLAPAVLLFQLITHALEGSGLSEYPEIAYAVILLPLFSALRLARFNTHDTQKSSFLGLAVPASALFFAGIALAAAYAVEIPGWPAWVGKQAFNPFADSADTCFFFFYGNAHEAFLA
ncbi:MAG: CDP-diacylglycerol--serine O-phosphatidyltransferase [Bacteroidales bacterium]|nr:CDP-diacylglycerol--serine O-phosphatidyltransferase [Bacteroidales bacterium]